MESAAAFVELIERVQLTADGIRIVLKISMFVWFVEPCHEFKDTHISRFLPMKMKRRGVELRIILNGEGRNSPQVDPALLKAIARARRWFGDVASGRVPSLTQLPDGNDSRNAMLHA
jgi:hypothetical protein